MTDLLPLVLDFETYYDKAYSLRKMPTAQYVRDERFRCLGAAVRLPGQDAGWLQPDELEAFLGAVPWDRTMLIAHNAQFDGLVLVERFGHRPAAYACTMFMTRYLIAQGVLDPNLGMGLKDVAPVVGLEKGDLDASLADGTLDAYATIDAEIAGRLFDRYWHTLPEDERDYIDLHVRMATEAVFDIDRPKLEVIAGQDKAMESLFPVLRKDDAFAGALRLLGVEPEYKVTPKGTRKLATAKKDRFMVRLLSHPNDEVRELAEVRQRASSTIKRTRAQRFLDVGAPLPAPLMYYGAHTGRASGLDSLNVQNLPRKGGMRECIVAPAGHVFVIIDLSQIEVRVNAWLAGETLLLDEFRRGVDPYLSFASYLYATPLDQMLAAYKAEGDAGGPVHDQRQVAKAAVLALGFGQGVNGFIGYCEAFGVPMTQELAERTVAAYRSRYACIVASWRETFAEAKGTGRQVLPSGRLLTYPETRVVQRKEGTGTEEQWLRPRIFSKSAGRDWSRFWHGVTVENKVQAVARDLVFWQIRNLARRWRVALSVHDEAVLVVPEDQGEAARVEAEEAFASVPAWAAGLPARGEARISKVYVK